MSKSGKKSVWQFIKDTVVQWIEDQPFQLAASLSYYTLFSLAPLLIIVIAIAGFAFGRQAAENRLVETIQDAIGQEGAQAIQALVQNASNKPKTGIISTLLGLVALFFGAGGVFGQLQSSLDTIWGVVPKSGLGIWGFARQRLISFAMILVIGFLLLVSLAVSAVLSGIINYMGAVLGRAAFVAQAADILLSFLFITALFAMMYKILPDARIQWRDVWVGAALTSFLFAVGKFLIGLYLGSGSVTSAYGAAASIILVLLWVYYSSLIFFLGAEFTQTYATHYGSGVVPAENAQWIAQAVAEGRRKSPPPEERCAEPVASSKLPV
ncbi:MAG TPA: YihY/virulence factor BrkB family protein [Candidatus Binatia bacterium]|nr:YihY/virulence factor BrkB family protein [Candidatus Binatia bacterium]